MNAGGIAYGVLLRLLDEALDLSAPERVDWLARLPDCHSDLRPTLRRMLLRADALETDEHTGLQVRIGRVLHEAISQPEAPTLIAGEHIGPYELVKEIGRGGMGVVWLANRADGAFQRSVALKLPHVSWSETFSERIGRERDILAGLEHPNIARFYDAGFDGLGVSHWFSTWQKPCRMRMQSWSYTATSNRPTSWSQRRVKCACSTLALRKSLIRKTKVAPG